MVLSAEHQCNWPRQLARTKKPKSRRRRVWRCHGEQWRAWLTANKGNAYVHTTVFLTCVTSPKHVSLLAAVRSLGLFPSFLASYAKGQRQRHVWCLARLLALHVLLVCACFAPACAYLAVVCAFASLFVLVDREIEKFIIRQPPIGEKDDDNSEKSWISDGLPSSSRRRRRGDGRWEVGEWREK